MDSERGNDRWSSGTRASKAMGAPVASVKVTVEGELDLRWTLGIDKEAPVGFNAIRLRFDVDAPDATAEQLGSVLERPSATAWCCGPSSVRRP